MSSSGYVERPGLLVVDANIVIGAALSGQGGGTRHLLRQLAGGNVTLLAPEGLVREVDRHLSSALDRSFARRGISGETARQRQNDAAQIWHDLQSSLWIPQLIEYRLFENAARRRVPADPDDWPYVALALRLDCGILTKNIAHFGASGIPIWSLETVRLLLEM